LYNNDGDLKYLAKNGFMTEKVITDFAIRLTGLCVMQNVVNMKRCVIKQWI